MEMNLLTIYKLQDILTISPFTSAEKTIENTDDHSRRLFTRVEGIKAGLAGHKIGENSVLRGVVNGIYMIEVKLDEEVHNYIGKASSKLGIGDRLCHHIHRLRSLPLRQDIIKIIQKKSKLPNLTKEKARERFRGLEFQDYEEIGSFFDEGSDNPFSILARKIREKVKSFEEQKKFFYENVRVGICEIEIRSNPELHEVLISLLEIYFLHAYEENGSLTSLNSVMPREENLINELKKYDPAQIETTLADYPTPFYHLISKTI